MNEVQKNYIELKKKLDVYPGALLLAVSKTFPAEDIAALYEIGVRDFGESRIGELQAKYEALPTDIRWHFIGNLQSNKVRKVLQYATVIHSVNSAALLSRIDRIAGEDGRHPELLLEVNYSGEASKEGMSLAEYSEVMKSVRDGAFKHVSVTGLMTMAPQGADEAELKRIFAGTRHLGEEYGLHQFSMGMSEDYPVALSCGSTIVRIGSKIFGKRDYST